MPVEPAGRVGVDVLDITLEPRGYLYPRSLDQDDTRVRRVGLNLQRKLPEHTGHARIARLPSLLPFGEFLFKLFHPRWFVHHPILH